MGCFFRCRRVDLLDLLSPCEPNNRIQSELSRNSSLRSITPGKKYHKNTPSPLVATRERKQKNVTRTSKLHVKKSMMKFCCDDMCCANGTSTSFKEVRKWFHSDGDKARSEGEKNIILKEIIDTGVASDHAARQKMMYMIPNTNIFNMCARAMKNMLGVSNWKWNKVKNGQADYEDVNLFSAKLRKSEKEELVYRFLKKSRDNYAERLPNHTDYDFPSNFTVGEMMRMFHVQNPLKSVTVQYFTKIWEVQSSSALMFPVDSFQFSFQRHYKNLKIPAYSKFSKCDTCFKTNTKKRKFSNETEKGSTLCFAIICALQIL